MGIFCHGMFFSFSTRRYSIVLYRVLPCNDGEGKKQTKIDTQEPHLGFLTAVDDTQVSLYIGWMSAFWGTCLPSFRLSKIAIHLVPRFLARRIQPLLEDAAALSTPAFSFHM